MNVWRTYIRERTVVVFRSLERYINDSNGAKIALRKVYITLSKVYFFIFACFHELSGRKELEKMYAYTG